MSTVAKEVSWQTWVIMVGSTSGSAAENRIYQ
jgi:hypothetical protein